MLAKKPATINQLWLIEDDDALRGFMALSLRSAGYEVKEFSNVDDADTELSHILKGQAGSASRPDLIITDNSTPGEMKGSEFTMKYGKQGAGLPIMLCSAETAAITAVNEHHAIKTMLKPISLPVFMNTVNEAATEVASPKKARTIG